MGADPYCGPCSGANVSRERFVVRAASRAGPTLRGGTMGRRAGLGGHGGLGVVGAFTALAALATAAGCIEADGDGSSEEGPSAADDTIGPNGRLAPKGMRVVADLLRGSPEAVAA